MEQRTQFTFYESFFKAVSRIKKKADRADAYDAICDYALYGKEPNDGCSPSVRSMFEEIRGELDKERRQSLEGRRCSEYKLWRRAVFERDDFTCQTCGKRGVKLNAHHKKSYAWYPELRYDISNGITLCETCHKALHRRRGHGD